MDTQAFDAELKQLSQMVGSFKSDELFNQEYENLLAKVRAEQDPALRHAQASRMRALLMHQCSFLMNEWLIAKREHDFYQL